MKFMTTKLVKPILVSVMLSFISFGAYAQNASQHEVKAGETLYSISKAYNVTIDQIKAVNPNLTDNIMAGQKINIPSKNQKTKVDSKKNDTKKAETKKSRVEDQIIITSPTNTEGQQAKVEGQQKPVDYNKKTTHEVQKKESFYSIAQTYGITVNELAKANPTVNAEKLKKGTILNIPYSAAEIAAIEEANKPKTPVVVEKKTKPVSIAIMMPFGLNSEKKKTREHITMIDFYEGCMLALSDLKKEGVSGNVYAYDEDDIDSILTLPHMKHLDVIIGGKEQENITKLIDFSEKNNICMVVPLSSTNSLVNNTKKVFQVNTKMENSTINHSYELYHNMHPNANYIFVNIEDQTDKVDYVTRMKTYLNGKNINYSTVSFKELETELLDAVVAGKENIIIPSSGTKTGFERLTKKLNEMTVDSYNINMFGYSDWQAFAEKESESFAKYNCSYFTTFFNNPDATESHAFNQKFYSTFGREQFNTYPHYGMLGYDVTKFFAKNMFEEGKDFITNIDKCESEALQNPLHFVRKNNWSGYINNALMYVRYNSDGTISVKQLR